MSVQIQVVSSRRDLRRFIVFPEKLYKGNPNWVHALLSDEFDTLGPKNAALEFCERELYLALRDGEIVGRVAAIINHRANEHWKENVVRFGWIDFIDDLEVVKALIGAVVEWGKARGCTRVKGPLGFSDMDKEGLLVEGFDHLSPFTVIYNYPYYGELLEKVGFVKDADWTQKIVDIPTEELPQMQYAALVEKRFGLRAVSFSDVRQLGADGRHLVVQLRSSGLRAVWWGRGDLADSLRADSAHPHDVLFSLDISTYQQPHLELRLAGLRRSRDA